MGNTLIALSRQIHILTRILFQWWFHDPISSNRKTNSNSEPGWHEPQLQLSVPNISSNPVLTVSSKNLYYINDDTDKHTLFKDPGSRLSSWRLKWEEYNYKIYLKHGKINKNADALSELKSCISNKSQTSDPYFHLLPATKQMTNNP